MTKTMLIDATSAQETRVAVVESGKLKEFDYESTSRKALKGNIYLAKVTRVEPSLQACFVEYGGNRHGFLPFSDIHPDYFRIPVADRQAFEKARAEALEKAIQAEAEAEAAIKEAEEQDTKISEEKSQENDDEKEVPAGDKTPQEEKSGEDSKPQEEESKPQEAAEKEDDGEEERPKSSRRRRGRGGRARGGARRMSARSKGVEILGGDNAYEEEVAFRFDLRKQYKIQEVVQRGQVLLVQASREERGNKGAAVTTYLSLPGRYCVLMPNSPRGGGVSRKIAVHKDRNRMRELLRELSVPQGMSVILRTAGVARTKTEVKRDLDYLMRLWDDLRASTLESSAPAMIYEEGDLIKRSVRDLYTRDIDEIIVAGEDGYQTARKFMKMMIPSHLRRVKQYGGVRPLFSQYEIEAKVADMADPEVKLKSGGSIVINPTEALVAIDVNSGKATKGRHIEETALKTNLEAASEIARQLKLRDLGGLIVVDFIDMDERRNNIEVERRMKDSLSGDRARIQIGRISSFGLLELSRQRLNPSLAEVQFDVCKACGGTGRVRSASTNSFMLLREIESQAMKAGKGGRITAQISGDIALHLLNNTRAELDAIEKDHEITLNIEVDKSLSPSEFKITKQIGEKPAPSPAPSKNKDSEDESEQPKKRSRKGGRGKQRKDKGDDTQSDDPSNENVDPNNSDKKQDALEQKPKEIEKPKSKPKPKPKPKAEPKASSSVEYEVVTEDKTTTKKKRGWWNRLID